MWSSRCVSSVRSRVVGRRHLGGFSSWRGKRAWSRAAVEDGTVWDSARSAVVPRVGGSNHCENWIDSGGHRNTNLSPRGMASAGDWARWRLHSCTWDVIVGHAR